MKLTPLGNTWLERDGMSMTCRPSSMTSDVKEPPTKGWSWRPWASNHWPSSEGDKKQSRVCRGDTSGLVPVRRCCACCAHTSKASGPIWLMSALESNSSS
eukprot:CAMPEP_0181205714 /NCGR_PEP_ID=MMETSP1096-20121128/20628_2 /TAXON_ID=156174 ORGANISM="Chrysochromulina ericina, Strain CCMP281" /NCGR_SAMPLE_ID=MMETSP1096 /ASSEMBLY_ACC=CAM_ASM_000453 /LENGTH=99 /DNA_ID=CAMNT_0023296523 /DNA_START=874 /DNA_END=1173 /DNA_ORIENTATION=-